VQITTNAAPETRSLPKADAPVKQFVPEVDFLPDLREVVEAIRIDCRLAPGEYLKELYVPGGGE
jgi:hypothetical protein